MLAAIGLLAGGLWPPAMGAELGETSPGKPEDRVAELRAMGLHVTENLRPCIDIRAGDERDYQNLTVKEVDIEVRQSIGECGCKSAVLGYSVYALRKDGKRMHKVLLNSNRVTAMQSRKALLVLSADNSDHLVANDILIEIGCARPE
jgi:hypothetical protein